MRGLLCLAMLGAVVLLGGCVYYDIVVENCHDSEVTINLGAVNDADKVSTDTQASLPVPF